VQWRRCGWGGVREPAANANRSVGVHARIRGVRGSSRHQDSVRLSAVSRGCVRLSRSMPFARRPWEGPGCTLCAGRCPAPARRGFRPRRGPGGAHAGGYSWHVRSDLWPQARARPVARAAPSAAHRHSMGRPGAVTAVGTRAASASETRGTRTRAGPGPSQAAVPAGADLHAAGVWPIAGMGHLGGVQGSAGTGAAAGRWWAVQGAPRNRARRAATPAQRGLRSAKPASGAENGARVAMCDVCASLCDDYASSV
jgi:hypothetical protein